MALPATRSASRASLLLLLGMMNCWQVALAAQASLQQRQDQLADLTLRPTSHMIAASWRLLNPSGQVTSFRVEWRKHEGFAEKRYRCTVQHRESESQQHSTKQCNETPMLQACSKYAVRVTGINNQAQVITESLQYGYTMVEVTNLTVSTVGGRSVTVSWRHPNTSCDVTGYYITYDGTVMWAGMKRHGGSVGFKHRGAVNSIYRFNLADMVPHSVYNVCVTAANLEGNWTKICVQDVYTNETEPSAPSSFTLVSSVHDMTATWNEPMEHNGVLGPYNVSWQCGANTAHKLVNTTVYTIKGLPSCAKCRVRVTASTAAGEGESSEATLWTQPEAPAPVTLQKSTTAGARTISLWWQRLSSKCNITSYYITYDGKAMWGEKNPHSASVVVQEGLVKTIYSYNLLGLVPYSRYNVCVAAGNQGGNSSVKCQEGFQTKQARPSTPSAFSVVTTAHTVSATWQEPQEHNGVLGPYNISWQCGANTSYELINTTVYTIEGLPAGVECRVRVAASTEAGEGERSEESVWIPSDPKLALIMGGTGATVLVTAVIVGGIILCRRGQARKMSRQRPTDKAVAETAPTTTATTIAVDAIANENDGDKSAITEAKEKRQLLNAPLPFRPMPPVPLEREPVNSNLESATGHDYYYVRPEDVKRAIVDETTPMMGNPEKIK